MRQPSGGALPLILRPWPTPPSRAPGRGKRMVRKRGREGDERDVSGVYESLFDFGFKSIKNALRKAEAFKTNISVRFHCSLTPMPRTAPAHGARGRVTNSMYFSRAPVDRSICIATQLRRASLNTVSRPAPAKTTSARKRSPAPGRDATEGIVSQLGDGSAP